MLTVLALIAFLLVGGLLWGTLHLRHSRRVAEAAVACIGMDDVEALCRECETVFSGKFAATLDLQQLEASARILSDYIDRTSEIKGAFAREHFYWYFVLPVGAYIGELIRIHAGGVWTPDEEGGLKMTIPLSDKPDDVATTYPFHKAIKQVTLGDKGDLYAFLLTAPTLREKAAAMVVEPSAPEESS